MNNKSKNDLERAKTNFINTENDTDNYLRDNNNENSSKYCIFDDQNLNSWIRNSKE